MTASPDDDEILRRLCEGDPIAPAQFCERFLPPLLDDRRWVAGRTRDQHLIEGAADDAVLDFVRNPERYDPSRLGIEGYLRMIAGRRLLNALAREQRHASRRAPLEVVELRPPVGNERSEAPELPGGISKDELLRRLREELPEPRDREAMALMMDGVRETPVYARLYGLDGLPPQEQARAVKRHKDRLKQRAKRLGVRLRHE
jgi:DNA-directed RNA polymerase specialized sigma24 family protein